MQALSWTTIILCNSSCKKRRPKWQLTDAKSCQLSQLWITLVSNHGTLSSPPTFTSCSLDRCSFKINRYTRGEPCVCLSGENAFAIFESKQNEFEEKKCSDGESGILGKNPGTPLLESNFFRTSPSLYRKRELRLFNWVDISDLHHNTSKKAIC